MSKSSLTKKISLINKVVLESMDAPDEYSIIKRFVQVATIILQADFGFSFIKDLGINKFKLVFKDSKTPYIPKVPRKNGTTNKAFLTGKPIYVRAAGKTVSIRKDAKKFMEGVVVIPMSYKKNNFGTIDICFHTQHEFTQEERVLCEYIGNSAAESIALQRSYSNLENLVIKRTAQLRGANASLRRDQASDQAILSSIGEGLIGTDKQGNVIFINPAAEQILQISRREILGRSLYQLQPLVDQQNQAVPSELRPTFRALNEGKRFTTSAYCYVKPSKAQVPIAITATPVILKNQIIGSIQVFRDISEEREVDRVKTELISLASHQLRTPLSAINWYAEALVKEEIGPLTKQQKKYLAQIQGANKKMIQMVYDFLNVSRIELGTFTVKLSKLDAAEVTREIIRELTPLIKDKSIKLTENYGAGLNAVEADHKILRVILQNLLTNAVKYTPSRGKIWISLSLEKNKTLHITVKDNGHGIPKKQQGKIFTKLFRADNASRLDAEGNGLGLYLAKSFVDLCHGKIAFTSKEGNGTTFTVTLPVKFSV